MFSHISGISAYLTYSGFYGVNSAYWYKVAKNYYFSFTSPNIFYIVLVFVSIFFFNSCMDYEFYGLQRKNIKVCKAPTTSKIIIIINNLKIIENEIL